jgi:F-type H+-transporting ATPase subunit a
VQNIKDQGVASPLQQFEIKPLARLEVGGMDVSFTNSSLFMMIVIMAVTLFMVLGMRKRAMVPGRWQSTVELFYEFIAGLVRDNVGSAGRPYFPFIFSLFMFILFANCIGLVPYAFTVTSHIIVTFALAAVVFVGVTIIAIAKHGMKFFSYFLPPGVPLYMAPLLIPIEVLSYLARPVTLSLRLFANMMAGHTMLKVFAGFVIALGVAGVAPLTVLVGLYMLELIVAVLQAFVFTILTCLYLHDAIHLH